MWLIHGPWFCCQALFYWRQESWKPLEEKVLTIWHLCHYKLFLMGTPKHFILSFLKNNSEEQDAFCSLWNFPIKEEYVKCKMCGSLKWIKIIMHHWSNYCGQLLLSQYQPTVSFHLYLWDTFSFPNPNLNGKF